MVERVYDIKERSADIYEHSLTICTIATLVALKLEMSEKDVYDISVSSLLHDLGLRYLVVRYENQDIHLLPNKDQEEYKKHPIYGYTAVKGEDWISDNAKDIISITMSIRMDQAIHWEQILYQGNARLLEYVMNLMNGSVVLVK